MCGRKGERDTATKRNFEKSFACLVEEVFIESRRRRVERRSEEEKVL
jgi:hypothetical protein